MPEDTEDRIGQVASERGRSSAVEGTKLLIAVSTGSLGVFFVVLTKAIDPPLTLAQQVIALIAVAAMGLAAANGLLSWWIDARAHIHLALARSAEDRKVKSAQYKARKRWKTYETWNNRSFFSAFAVGIFSAIVFLMFRIIANNPGIPFGGAS